MNRKILIFISLSFFYTVSLFGAGKKDVETRTAENPDSWNELFDISAKKKGKYNVIVTAEDIAGNVGVKGPFNMYIDPNSDLPVVHINNPTKYMNVTGNLNVSGTCFDDDAVDHVEVAIDDGEPIRAKGRQFWSCFFSIEGLEEGIHTVNAHGVDINGLAGKVISVPFHINSKSPVTSITNIEAGTLISGKKTFEGVVSDGNGAAKLFYSLDSGETYRAVPLKHKKKEELSRFRVVIDTRDMSDGPQVCWFKAVDRLGTVGISTFLFFIDNTGPTVDFSYPPEGEVQGSRFAIGGSARDLVSLEGLSWRMGKESGEFELVKGNPYWVKEFDVSSSSRKSETIEIIAKDTAGNITTVKRKIQIDKEKDKPQVTLISPQLNAVTENSVYLAGFVDSAYGVSEIHYSLDRGAETVVPVTDCSFGVNIENLSTGNHTLSIYALNASNVRGAAETITFSSRGKRPVITVDKSTGVVQNVPANNKAVVPISIVSDAGLKSVEYTVGADITDGASVKKGAKNVLIRVPYNAGFTGQLTPISVHAVDMFDRSTNQTILVSSAVKGEEQFLWAPGERTDDGAIILSNGAILNGVYRFPEGSAASIESVSLEGAADAFETSFLGDVITLAAKKDGRYKNIKVIITDTDGNTFTSEGVTILSDTRGPAITVKGASDIPKTIKQTSVPLNGKVSSTAGLKTVSYSINHGDPVEISSTFSETISIADIPESLILVEVTAEDVIGNKSIVHQLFYKDTDAPQVTMVLPKPEDTVNGSIVTAFKVDNFFNLKKAEYKPAGSNEWKEMPLSPLIHTLIGTAEAPISKDMRFRFTDKADNVATYSNFEFKIAEESDKPVLEIHVPSDNATIFADFYLSGVVYDDDGVSKIFYKIDDGAFQSLEIKDTFSIPFMLSDFKDNDHTISLYAEDIYGVKSNVVERKIRVSLNIPETEVVTPRVNEMVKGTVEITGTANDKNGIAYVELSFDNGNSYNRAQGKKEWKYILDTKMIEDGTHVVFVRTYDNYGQSSIVSGLLNIDNTPPSLTLKSPISGSKYDDALLVAGTMHDATMLDNVVLKIKGLEGQRIPSALSQIKLEKNMLIEKKLDISELSAGRYNLEIIAYDTSNNATSVSRNFDVERGKEKNKIELLYPLNGESLTGEITIYGKINHTSYPQSVSLYVDNKEYLTAPVSLTGYFNFKIPENELAKGLHRLSVKAVVVGNKLDVSNTHDIHYRADGPWITIDNFAMGDFVVDRPYLKGRVGYTFSEKEKELLATKKIDKELLSFVNEKKVTAVEISFDNGKTFEPIKVSKKGKWKYRLEPSEMEEGYHFVLVRGLMANTEVAVARTVVRVDKSLPNVTLITPHTGGMHNESIEYSGLSNDNIMVKKVEMSLRKGDKYFYSVPKGLQGLHFDVGFLGATLWNVGIGLSFFDSKVKLQLHYGQLLGSQWNNLGASKKTKNEAGIEKMRYGGSVVSAKILANVYELAFERFAGPDWAWLHLSAAVGANFSLFTDTQSKKTQVLSAMITQLEFPRIKLPKKKVKYFNKFSFYTEGQLWFIPTDVSNPTAKPIQSVIPRISFGLRAEVF